MSSVWCVVCAHTQRSDVQSLITSEMRMKTNASVACDICMHSPCRGRALEAPLLLWPSVALKLSLHMFVERRRVVLGAQNGTENISCVDSTGHKQFRRRLKEMQATVESSVKAQFGMGLELQSK